MSPLNIFFPTDILRDNYMRKIFEKNGIAYLENPQYLLDIGVEHIVYKNQYKAIPGCWVCIKYKNEKSKERALDLISKVIPHFWMEEYLFFPKEITSQKRMEELWIQKYNINEESNDSMTWTIFFMEIKKHCRKGRMDIANIALMCIYKRNPYFLKKYKRYYVFEDLAYYFEAKGELHKSIKCLKIQASLQPDSPEPYLNMSSFLLLNGFNEEAIDVCEKGLQISPEDEYLSNNLLIAYFNGEYFDTALTYLKKHIENKPEDPMGWKVMGDIFFQIGKNKMAIDSYQKALSIKSCDIQEVEQDVYYGLGMCYHQLGKIKEAIRCYKKLLKYNSTDGLVLLNLSKLYGDDLRKYDEAEFYGKKFVRLYPQDGYGHHNLGLIYLSTGRFDKAKWYLYKARKLIPNYPPVHEAIVELKREGKRRSV